MKNCGTSDGSGIDDDDGDEWIRATSSTERLKAAKRVAAEVKAEKVVVRKRQTLQLEPPKTAHVPQDGLQESVLRELRKNKRKPDAVLDLHGASLEKAYGLLLDFIRDNYTRQKRFLHIITGKGRGEPTIASSFAGWISIQPFSDYISSYQKSPANLGGEGAWLVYLRKKRMH